MALSFHDTLSGRVRPVPRHAGSPMTLYVCGPTVYDRSHVGHARTYLYFDVIRRYLQSTGVPVRHVMNITDYEDKITERARRLGVSWRTLARREEARFWRDLARLRILAPQHRPRASDYIPQMLAAIRRLERTGHISEHDGEWRYVPARVAPKWNFALAAELSQHVVPEPGREPLGGNGAALEFTVWKRQAAPNPSWPSPYGSGAPGWHLECYAMASQILGIPVDIHGGGTDLIFPHHYAENEVAFALDGAPFARRFLHTAFVTDRGVKMSKSVGNLVPLEDALALHGPDALRWYLLGNPVGERLEWDDVAFDRAALEYSEMRSAFRAVLPNGRGGSFASRRLEALARSVESEIASGLGVDRAWARMRTFVQEVRASGDPRASKGDGGVVRLALKRLGRVTGLSLA